MVSNWISRNSKRNKLFFNNYNNCETTKGQIVSSFFLIQKPDGKINYRFILNLKKLNAFVKTEHFKLEDLRAQFIGLLVASYPGIEYGTIYSKSLEKAKLEALEGNHIDFDRKMKIPAYRLKKTWVGGRRN